MPSASASIGRIAQSRSRASSSARAHIDFDVAELPARSIS